MWAPREARSTPKAPTGVFAHLAPTATPPATLAAPPVTLTWEKFVRTVLPTAARIEAQTPATPERFVALVTASDPAAPPILQWDVETNRNPFSWYYHAGIDADFQRRVESAGGQYKDVDIRATLIWNNRNDLDLHVQAPGEYIYFGSKRAPSGGFLDVDMNVFGETTTPVENTRWPKSTARPGRYRVFVRNFRFHERFQDPTAFQVEIEVAGEVYRFAHVIAPKGETGPSSDVLVMEFDFARGRPGVLHPWGMPTVGAPTTTSTAPAWNLAPGAFAEVSAIVPSPNLWGTPPAAHHGRHMLFLLRNCQDTNPSHGRGFFVETLKSEYAPIGRTLEAHMRTAELGGADTATACGLGMTDQRPWNLTLRVTPTGGGPAVVYKLDRWD